MIIVSNPKLSSLATLKCERCGVVFERKRSQVNAALKGSKKNRLKYCSNECQWQSKKNKVMVSCKKCGIEFLKLPSQIKKSPNHFCSKSCACSWNSKHCKRKHGPNKTKLYRCKVCQVNIQYGHVYCLRHGPNCFCLTCNKRANLECKTKHETAVIAFEEKTIKQLLNDSGFKSSQHRAIRDHARKVMKKSGLPLCCKICGYSKHVAVCHIKPISCFNQDTTVKTVNSLDNLVCLCYNHHWELDNEMLSEKDKANLLK